MEASTTEKNLSLSASLVILKLTDAAEENRNCDYSIFALLLSYETCMSNVSICSVNIKCIKCVQ